MPVLVAKSAVLVLAILVLAGGIMGFAKAKSKASLIAGIVSAILLAASFAVTYIEPRLGLIQSFGVIIVLEAFFCVRYVKTKKSMPALPMMVLCSIALALVVFGLLKLQ